MRFDDLEFEEALPLLSAAPSEAGLSRRRFLQGALAAAASGVALSMLDTRAARAAEAARPLLPTEGVLVVVFLGGGNDGLNMLAPIAGAARDHYDQLRGGIAVPPGALLPVGGDWGLHPKLPALHRRFAAGDVALVEGTGMPVADLSHFTATAKVMRGSVEASSGSGWLGSFLDGLPDASAGFRGLSVGSAVPMFLVGNRAQVTSVPSDGVMPGASRAQRGEAARYDALAALASAPSGLGHWGDSIAATGRTAIAHAQRLSSVFAQEPGAPGLARDLLIAARLINLDLGARAVGVTFGGWDTHAAEPGLHEAQLQRLDDAIEVFFANLGGRFRNRVTMLVQSEFGRRPAANASLGTDHGTAGPMLLIGSNVRGGRHGAPPALDRLDDRGNMTPTVDFRSVYATLLERWLGADPGEVLQGRFERLDLLAAGPGSRG